MFPAAASRAVEKCAESPPRIVDDRMTGSAGSAGSAGSGEGEGGRTKVEKGRQEERQRTKKKRGEKGESRGRGGGDRPSIILQSGQDGRDSKLPVSRLRLRLGTTYSF